MVTESMSMAGIYQCRPGGHTCLHCQLSIVGILKAARALHRSIVMNWVPSRASLSEIPSDPSTHNTDWNCNWFSPEAIRAGPDRIINQKNYRWTPVDRLNSPLKSLISLKKDIDKWSCDLVAFCIDYQAVTIVLHWPVLRVSSMITPAPKPAEREVSGSFIPN